MGKKLLVCVLSVAMLVTMLAGCGQTNNKAGDSTGTAKPAKDSVVIAMNGDLASLDPINALSVSDQIMASNLYNCLITMDKSGKFIPDLAESWTISDDGLTYTFKLVKGVKFHNGEELKASDVAFSFNTAKKSAYLAQATQPIKEVVAIDDYNVKITLSAAYVPFMLNLSGIGILNEKAVKEAGSNYGKDNAVGTGPYKFVKHAAGQNVIFERFDDYFKGKVAIKNVEYKIITDQNAALIALKSGEVDFAHALAAISLKSLENNSNFTIHKFKGAQLAYVLMNTTKKPFDNVLVRQAINYAIDKDAIIQMALEGIGEKADSVVNELSFGYSKNVKGYEYNPEKAKELLAKAGYPNGFKVTFKTIDGTLKKISEVVQECLSKIGITANVEMYEKNVYFSDLTSGNYELGDISVSMLPDFDNWEAIFASKGGFNASKYSNPKVDELFSQAKKTINTNERLEKYEEIQQIVNDDAVIAPLFFPTNYYVGNKDLKMGDIDYGGTYRIAEMSWTK